MPLKCDAPGCDRTFTTQTGLSVHRAHVHNLLSDSIHAVRSRNYAAGYHKSGSPADRRRCRECGVPFRNPSALARHVARFHRTPLQEVNE